MDNSSKISPSSSRLKRKIEFKPNLFQKYIVIRLNEILFRKQLSSAFDELKKLKQQAIMPTTVTLNCQEQIQYQVSLEIIRPKIRGEVIFKKTYDITQINTRKKKGKIIQSIQVIDNKIVDKTQQEQETKVNEKQAESLKQLIDQQNFNKKKLQSSKTQLEKAKQRNDPPYISIILILLLIVYITI